MQWLLIEDIVATVCLLDLNPANKVNEMIFTQDIPPILLVQLNMICHIGDGMAQWFQRGKYVYTKQEYISVHVDLIVSTELFYHNGTS